jgi:hypothetical protein
VPKHSAQKISDKPRDGPIRYLRALDEKISNSLLINECHCTQPRQYQYEDVAGKHTSIRNVSDSMLAPLFTGRACASSPAGR